MMKFLFELQGNNNLIAALNFIWPRCETFEKASNHGKWMIMFHSGTAFLIREVESEHQWGKSFSTVESDFISLRFQEIFSLLQIDPSCNSRNLFINSRQSQPKGSRAMPVIPKSSQIYTKARPLELKGTIFKGG
jgi:hypothetical protein